MLYTKCYIYILHYLHRLNGDQKLSPLGFGSGAAATGPPGISQTHGLHLVHCNVGLPWLSKIRHVDSVVSLCELSDKNFCLLCLKYRTSTNKCLVGGFNPCERDYSMCNWSLSHTVLAVYIYKMVETNQRNLPNRTITSRRKLCQRPVKLLEFVNSNFCRMSSLAPSIYQDIKTKKVCNSPKMWPWTG